MLTTTKVFGNGKNVLKTTFRLRILHEIKTTVRYGSTHEKTDTNTLTTLSGSVFIMERLILDFCTVVLRVVDSRFNFVKRGYNLNLFEVCLVIFFVELLEILLIVCIYTILFLCQSLLA